MPVDNLQLDKDFMSAPPQEQTEYLAHVDPDFKAASPEDQKAYLSHITSGARPPAAQRAEAPKPSTLERADTAVTNALEPTTADVSPDSGVVRSQLIAPAKTLGREVYSAGKTALGLIPGVVHAFTDKPTEEEKAQHAQFEKEQGEAPGTETSGLKRIGLGIDRLTTAPLIGAANTYANPKTRPTYEDALSVAPEALGQGAGTVVGGQLIKSAAKQTPAVARAAIDTAKDATQRDLPAIKGMPRIPGTEKPSPLGTAYAEPSAKPAGEVSTATEQEVSQAHKTVNELSDAEHKKLGQRFGVSSEGYDERTSKEEGRHRVGRDAFHAKTTEAIPEALNQHLVDAEKDWNEANPQTFDKPSRSHAANAERAHAIVEDALDRWQPKPSMPRIGGSAKVKAPSDFSQITKKLMTSLGVSPEKLLDDMEGTDSQIRNQLLKFTQADLNKYRK